LVLQPLTGISSEVVKLGKEEDTKKADYNMKLLAIIETELGCHQKDDPRQDPRKYARLST
jgi:hypothetical protein